MTMLRNNPAIAIDRIASDTRLTSDYNCRKRGKRYGASKYLLPSYLPKWGKNSKIRLRTYLIFHPARWAHVTALDVRKLYLPNRSILVSAQTRTEITSLGRTKVD
jgi:hypothetical protein